MNLAALFNNITLLRSQIYLVFCVLAIVVALPVIAVFGLGRGTLSVLSSSSTSSDGLYEGPISKTDLYDYGNCTYWAALQREQVGKPIPNTWGNANTWAIRATLDGYAVDHTPSVTAIMQTSAGVLGHVAYVTGVSVITGAWTISEMNVKGLDIVDTQTLSSAAANEFIFIHDN